jgi:PucR C-terminal helix-turn-helix domain
MATFADLRAAILPNGRWLAAGPDAARSTATRLELAWVRRFHGTLSRVDALDPGDLAVVPRSGLTTIDGEGVNDGIADVVRGLAEIAIGGIVLVGDGESLDAQAADQIGALVDAAEAAGLPILDAGTMDAAAVERSAIGFLVNHRAELERQATLLETQLEQVALAGGGPEGLAAAIAGFLGRAIAIEGRGGATLAVHVPPNAPAGAAAIAAYHRRRRSAATRIALPIPGAGGAAANSGALALLGERPPSELERVATARIAGLVALELARDEALGRAVETARSEPLPADGPPWVVIVARQAPSAADASDLEAVSVAARASTPGREPRDGDAEAREALRRETLRREAVRREVRSLAPVRRLSLRGDVQSVELRIVAAIDAADADGSAIGARIAALLGRHVAVSRPFDSYGGRSSAEADARATLEAVEAMTNPPIVARADRLPAYRLLGSLHNLPDGQRQARALLAPLLRGRADVRRERLATLRAVLEQPGLAEAAAALGVHRNTVAYRLRRIEATTGWRLADPDLRLPLAMALSLVQDD